MGRLVVVVGNSGVGKTTLTLALARVGGFAVGLEQHVERPFQVLFAAERQRWGLANQIDYLLYRAEQEQVLRSVGGIAVQDGGLDLDYHVFSKRFAARGYMNGAEHALCERFYSLLRSLLPPPDLIIRLNAPLAVTAERYARRARTLEIADLTDLAELQRLLDQWLATSPWPLLEVDASDDGFCSETAVVEIVKEIEGRVGWLSGNY